MTCSLHASNGQQESASNDGDYVSAEEYRAMIDKAERSHATSPEPGDTKLRDLLRVAKRLRDHAVRYANDYGYNVAHDLNAAADHIEALESVLNYVADMTYCGTDAEWHFKPGYDPQRVLDASSWGRPPSHRSLNK